MSTETFNTSFIKSIVLDIDSREFPCTKYSAIITEIPWEGNLYIVINLEYNTNEPRLAIENATAKYSDVALHIRMQIKTPTQEIHVNETTLLSNSNLDTVSLLVPMYYIPQCYRNIQRDISLERFLQEE